MKCSCVPLGIEVADYALETLEKVPGLFSDVRPAVKRCRAVKQWKKGAGFIFGRRK
jgi:hypothetical protein